MAARPLSGSSSRILVLATAIVLGFGMLGAVWLFARAFALIVLAVTLASAFHPLACRLERHMPRAAAVIGLYVAFFGGIATTLFLLAPSVSDDLSRLGTQLPQLADRVSSAAGRVLPFGADALARVIRDVLPRIVSATSGLLSAGIDVLVVIFLSLYFLLEARDAHHTAVRLVAPSQRRRLSRLLSRVLYEMGGYVRGALLNGIVVAGLTWIALLVVGLDYAAPLAVVAFFGELLPYVGPVLAAIPAIAVALTQSPTLAVTVALVYVAIQQIEGHVLTPVIMHSQTHISAALVIVALTMGYTVGGMLGAITAIPLFAAGRVIVVHVIAPALRHQMGAGRAAAGRSGGGHSSRGTVLSDVSRR